MNLFLTLLTSIILAIGDEETQVCLSMEEAKLYKLINEYRDEKNLPAIPFSAKLTQVAQAHVHDLADNYSFKTDNKCNPHSWSKNATWTDCCYTSDHRAAKCMWNKPREIAGYDGNGYEIAYYSSAGANASQGLEGWQKSASHNPLLINSGIWRDIDWQGVGVGIYKEYAVVWFGGVKDQSEVTVCN